VTVTAVSGADTYKWKLAMQEQEDEMEARKVFRKIYGKTIKRIEDIAAVNMPEPAFVRRPRKIKKTLVPY
jgi:hypothetical protein